MAVGGNARGELADQLRAVCARLYPESLPVLDACLEECEAATMDAVGVRLLTLAARWSGEFRFLVSYDAAEELRQALNPAPVERHWKGVR